MCESFNSDDARAEFIRAVEDDLLDWSDDLTEEKAHERLSEFRCGEVGCSDSWEWNFRRFSWRYIWACYAITWAIGQYKAATKAPEEVERT